MSLKFAMLGFIDMMPLAGYDLKKMFDGSIKNYWTATHAQIYRTLVQMEKDNLIKTELIIQSNAPNKKIYHITDQGKDELEKWVKTTPELPPVRHKLLVQLSWSDRLSNEEIIEILENYCREIENKLTAYQGEATSEYIEYGRTKRARFLWDAILDNGKLAYEAELKWARKTIKGLINLKGLEAKS